MLLGQDRQPALVVDPGPGQRMLTLQRVPRQLLSRRNHDDSSDAPSPDRPPSGAAPPVAGSAVPAGAGSAGAAAAGGDWRRVRRSPAAPARRGRAGVAAA